MDDSTAGVIPRVAEEKPDLRPKARADGERIARSPGAPRSGMDCPRRASAGQQGHDIGIRGGEPQLIQVVGPGLHHLAAFRLEYPFHDRTITVSNCGRICIGRRKINLSTVFAGQNVGIKEVSDKVWLVSFMQYDLGFFDHEPGRITSAENPFGAKVLPMCPE